MDVCDVFDLTGDVKYRLEGYPHQPVPGNDDLVDIRPAYAVDVCHPMLDDPWIDHRIVVVLVGDGIEIDRASNCLGVKVLRGSRRLLGRDLLRVPGVGVAASCTGVVACASVPASGSAVSSRPISAAPVAPSRAAPAPPRP